MKTLLLLAAAVAAAQAITSHLGCYRLTGVSQTFLADGKADGPDACLDRCQEKGREWTHGALIKSDRSASSRCLCARKAALGKLRKGAARQCSRRCSGNRALFCGGRNVASLYEYVGQPGEAIRFSIRVVGKNSGA